MVTEYAPKGKRGFYGSWPQIGFAGGLAISTSIIWIMSTSLSDAAFESWGWRVPFFASALLVAVGLWIRLKIEETPAFTELQEKQEREKAPAVEVVRDHKKPRAARDRHALLGEHHLLHADRVRALLRRGRARHLAQHAARRDHHLRASARAS